MVDAVQPMKTGWWIYLRTQPDRDRLVAQGITVAGKHIPLHSEFRSNTQCSVKIVLKDLPLYMVDNSQVLDAMTDQCKVVSEVFCGTLWQDNQPTSIRNDDRFLYVLEGVVSTLPDTIMVAGMPAWLFKPRAMVTCKRCKQTGHIMRDSQCPAKAPAVMAESIELFRGGANPLSNLHLCPEGCEILDGQHDFLSIEQHYQFKRLCFIVCLMSLTEFWRQTTVLKQ